MQATHTLSITSFAIGFAWRALRFAKLLVKSSREGGGIAAIGKALYTIDYVSGEKRNGQVLRTLRYIERNAVLLKKRLASFCSGPSVPILGLH